MYRILEKQALTPVSKLYVVEAPQIARKARAGQFVVLRIHDKGERVPLTIADSDAERGTITLVVQEVGKSTKQMGDMAVGDSLTSLAGPLGHPTEIERYGTVVIIGGGLGVAPIHPICKALKEAGNTVISIIGARNKELLFWEDQIKAVSDEVIVVTDDGSYGRKGLVTEPLKEMLEAGRQIDAVWAIGPAIMMKFVSLTTKPYGVKTFVSLNSIMVDGTGMCGGCRVSVAGKNMFACVHGPEFDGHDVDWDLLLSRQRQYTDMEKVANEAYEEEHECNLEKALRQAEQRSR